MSASESSIQRMYLSPFFKASKREESPPIHYIWVGPKQGEVDNVDLQGQDIDGPIAMSKRVLDGEINNTIHFWCLKEHAPMYADLLNPFGIQVNAIEDLLKQYVEMEYSDSSTEPSIISVADAARFVQQLMQDTLASDRNTTRDKVTVKNIFSLFLLLTNRAYVMDTNIIPIEGETVALPIPKKFTHAILTRDIKINGHFFSNGKEKKCVKFAGIVDFFMMFSPQPNDKAVQQIFARFVTKWPEIMKIYKSEGYYISFHNESARLMATSIIGDGSLWYACASNNKAHYEANDYFYFIRPNTRADCNFAFLGLWNFSQTKPTISFGIGKIFNQTHKLGGPAMTLPLSYLYNDIRHPCTYSPL